jgi:predicted  nucleic acid-binding Zn-ribbon protein
MHAIMEALVRLQKIELGTDAESPAAQAAAEKLRAEVPAQILGHYVRLRARGKKGLALVRNQVCAECHVSVPTGTVVSVMKGLDIQLCGNCGRYLYLEPAAPTPEPEPAAAVAKPKRGRKPKKKSDGSVG